MRHIKIGEASNLTSRMTNKHLYINHLMVFSALSDGAPCCTLRCAPQTTFGPTYEAEYQQCVFYIDTSMSVLGIDDCAHLPAPVQGPR